MIISRSIAPIVMRMAKGFPVVAVTGPRQSGKTTLVRQLFANRPYQSLEPLDIREFAEEDPRGFLGRFRAEGVVLDEIQQAPGLFSYLQEMVDQDPTPGKFILTGSQQFGLLSGITQSLAGRVGMVELLPFSMAERWGDDPPGRWEDVAFTGLYPPVHSRPVEPYDWHASYVRTYVERDVRQLTRIQDLPTFLKFTRLCAGRIGQLLNLSALGAEAGISHNTAKAWLDTLATSYLVFLVQPHHRNFSKRLVKTPKLYFHDTGLASWLLGVQHAAQWETHPLRGALFENLIISEMWKARAHSGKAMNIHFWRDHAGHEVDVLLDQAGTLVPVEIKSGETVRSDWLGDLEHFRAIAGDAAERPRLVYGGGDAGVRKGVEILSWRNVQALARLATGDQASAG